MRSSIKQAGPADGLRRDQAKHSVCWFHEVLDAEEQFGKGAERYREGTGPSGAKLDMEAILCLPFHEFEIPDFQTGSQPHSHPGSDTKGVLSIRTILAEEPVHPLTRGLVIEAVIGSTGRA